MRTVVGFLAIIVTRTVAAPPDGAMNHIPAMTHPSVNHLQFSESSIPIAGRLKARVHDPSSIVRCKGDYWIFATGQGIASLHSRDRIHWQAGPPVFPTPPGWIASAVPGNQGYFWAPDVIHFKGRYLLYYSVSRWGSRTSAIALATSPSLDPTDPLFHWTDEGVVIQTGEQDDFNAIDPSVATDASGRLWLALGSFWSGIKLIQLDPATGKRIAPGSPLFSLAYHDTIEAACLFHHRSYYYLMVNWGLCCRGVNSTYNIRIGRSAAITGPYLDRHGNDLVRGGGDLLLGTTGAFIGPGHAGILKQGRRFWLSCHFYDGAQNGAATLALLPLGFDGNGWPIVEAAVH